MALTRAQKNTVRNFFKRCIRDLVEIQTYLKVRPESIECIFLIYCMTKLQRRRSMLVLRTRRFTFASHWNVT